LAKPVAAARNDEGRLLAEPASFQVSAGRLFGGGNVRCRRAHATATRLGRLVLRIVGGSDVERRRQTVGIDAVALGRFGDRSRRGRRSRGGLGRGLALRVTTRTTATRARCEHGRIRLEHRFGAFLQILALGERVGAALAGDFDRRFRLEAGTTDAILTLGAILTLLMRAILTRGALFALGTIVAVAVALAAIVPLARLALVAVLAIAALRALVAIAAVVALLVAARLTLLLALRVATVLLAGADRFTLVAVIVVVVEIERLLALGLAVVLEPAALVGDHAEIMIRELEVIFGVDPVALALRLTGEILVLLEQLVRVAARATVDTIAVVGSTLATLTGTVIATIVTATTATAAVLLPIVDQATVP
jgi:hypothetical protein